MNTPEQYVAPLWPLGVYFVAVLAVVTGMIAGSYFLGPRRRHPGMGPYEGGIAPAGSSRLRMTANFYLVAMFFVIFDLEAIFIYAWAVSIRSLGWPGYIEIVVFIGVLIAVLIYLLRLGALEQGARTERRRVLKA